MLCAGYCRESGGRRISPRWFPYDHRIASASSSVRKAQETGAEPFGSDGTVSCNSREDSTVLVRFLLSNWTGPETLVHDRRAARRLVRFLSRVPRARKGPHPSRAKTVPTSPRDEHAPRRARLLPRCAPPPPSNSGSYSSFAVDPRGVSTIACRPPPGAHVGRSMSRTRFHSPEKAGRKRIGISPSGRDLSGASRARPLPRWRSGSPPGGSTSRAPSGREVMDSGGPSARRRVRASSPR